MPEKIAIIYGTRPEFLKVFPLINEFRKNNREVCIINTGQHDSMLSEMEQSFGIIPDYALQVQSSEFSNSNLIAKLLNELSAVIRKENLMKIVAQGDTFTVLASSMVAFMEQRKFYHIEAGLRTSTIKLPFPEEYNRRVVSLGSDINFAPTSRSSENLKNEGVEEITIKTVGNTIVDMINYVLEKENIAINYSNSVFITAHRRENIGSPMQKIATAIRKLAVMHPEVTFHWALHPNPNTRKIILESFGNEKPDNINFTEPLGYTEAIRKMAEARLLISDSGGIQEEAPTLRKRVLILREETERPEVLECNCGVLVGSDTDRIIAEFERIWNSSDDYMFEENKNPFGDGSAAIRIYEELLR